MIKNIIENTTLVWGCSQCGKDIAPTDVDSDGISAGLMMSHKEMSRACDSELGWAAYERKQIRESSDEESGFRSINLADMMKETENLHKGSWAVYCSKCIVDKNDVYFISINRVQTIMSMLDWTLHLNKKGWTEHTNWEDIIREISKSYEDSKKLI
jgi:hypothetical protein